MPIDYSGLAKARKRAGHADVITPIMHNWEQDGTSVIGEFRYRTRVKSAENEGYFYLYVFDTNRGREQFAMSSSIDESVGSQLLGHGLYEITYLGKQTTRKGRSTNTFEIIYLGPVPHEENHGETEHPTEDTVPTSPSSVDADTVQEVFGGSEGDL